MRGGWTSCFLLDILDASTRPAWLNGCGWLLGWFLFHLSGVLLFLGAGGGGVASALGSSGEVLDANDIILAAVIGLHQNCEVT